MGLPPDKYLRSSRTSWSCRRWSQWERRTKIPWRRRRTRTRVRHTSLNYRMSSSCRRGSGARHRCWASRRASMGRCRPTCWRARSRTSLSVLVGRRMREWVPWSFLEVNGKVRLIFCFKKFTLWSFSFKSFYLNSYILQSIDRISKSTFFIFGIIFVNTKSTDSTKFY